MALASPITRDLRIDGFGLVAVGLAGVIAAAVMAKGGPGLALIPFIIVALVFGLAQVVVSGGWLRTAVAKAGPPPPGLIREDESHTMRRAGLPTLVAVVLVAIALFAWLQFAALLAGVAFAAGMMDVRSRTWISKHEGEHDVMILREVTWLPFATSRRPLWAEPRDPS